MGCKSCRDKGRNKTKSVSPRFAKCNFCGRTDIRLPLKKENKRGNKIICTQCILKGVK